MLQFDWDAANIEHVARHGVTPAQVEQVFANDPVEKGRRNLNGEERFIAQGIDNRGRVIVVVATIRGGNIRPITAYPVHRSRKTE